MEQVQIPIAAVFPFPSLSTLLIVDHFKMYYEVQGDSAVQIPSESGLKISLRNARYGTLGSRWPSLGKSEPPSNMDFDAFVHQDVPYFCYYKKDPVC